MSELSKQALKVDNNQSFPNNNNGAITPAILRSFNEDMIDSTVNQTIYTADSASFTNRIDVISNEVDVLQAFSSSQHDLNQTLATTGSNTFVGNQTIEGSLTLSNGGVDVTIVPSAVSGGLVITDDLSIEGNLTASLPNGYVWLGNANGKAVAVPSSSIAAGGSTDLGPLNAFTASQETYNTNNNAKWTTIGSQSGSWVTESETGSFARTDVTNTFTATQNIQGDLNITGTITANEIHTIIESSSVIFSSGSNILGDDPNTDTQTLNGAVVISGSATLNGSPIVSSIQTGSFATTGSNTFTGNQVIGNASTLNVAGDIIGNSTAKIYNQNASITLAANAQNSGSQYPGANIIVAPNTYPTDIFGGYSVLTELGNQAGQTFLGLVASTYSPQYGGTNVPMIIANGNNPAGNDTAIIWTSNGNAEHWKKSVFKYGIDVTGSISASGAINFTPASVSTNASYPITFVSGTTISKDSVDTLLYNPSTNTLVVSASATGNASVSANAISFSSGSGTGTYSAALTKTLVNNSVAGQGIGISGNPSKVGAPSLTNTTNPAILITSSSGQLYPAIEFNVSGSGWIDGRTIFKRKLIAEQGTEITGSFTAKIPTASAESQVNLFNFAPFVGANGTTYTSANISLQDYASSAIDQTFTVEYANADFQKYTGLVVGPTTAGSLAKFTLNTGVGYDFDEISLVDNGNNTSTALIKSDTNILNGATQITGSLGISAGAIVSGSVRGNVNPITISGTYTASFDFSTANFFEVTLTSGADTRVEATNVKPGQTVNVLVQQPVIGGTGTISFSDAFQFPAVSPYTASLGDNVKDIVTFITFADTSSIYSVAVKNLI